MHIDQNEKLVYSGVTNAFTSDCYTGKTLGFSDAYREQSCDLLWKGTARSLLNIDSLINFELITVNDFTFAYTHIASRLSTSKPCCGAENYRVHYPIMYFVQHDK